MQIKILYFKLGLFPASINFQEGKQVLWKLNENSILLVFIPTPAYTHSIDISCLTQD